MLAYKLKALEACLFPACHICNKEDKDGVGRYCETPIAPRSVAYLFFFFLRFYF